MFSMTWQLTCLQGQRPGDDICGLMGWLVGRPALICWRSSQQHQSVPRCVFTSICFPYFQRRCWRLQCDVLRNYILRQQYRRFGHDWKNSNSGFWFSNLNFVYYSDNRIIDTRLTSLLHFGHFLAVCIYLQLYSVKLWHVQKALWYLLVCESAKW